MNLSKNVKITVVNAAAAAGTSAVNSSIIDMSGFDGVVFVALVDSCLITSVVTLTVQENTVNSSSGMTAITGGATAPYTGLGTESGIAFLVDVYIPQQRYLRANFTRTTANAVLDGILAIQYRGDHMPTVQDVSVIASAFVAPTA